MKRVELLRDVFVWAYERSCRHYLAIRETRGRARSGTPLAARDIDRRGGRDRTGLQAPDAAAVRAAAASLMPSEDLDRVVEPALVDLRNLREGNVTRYRLRLPEYRAWQSRQQAAIPR